VPALYVAGQLGLLLSAAASSTHSRLAARSPGMVPGMVTVPFANRN
jgi:hypothetical protein